MASLSSNLTSVTVSFSGLRVTNGNKKKIAPNGLSHPDTTSASQIGEKVA